jgi:hypothetical protein
MVSPELPELRPAGHVTTYNLNIGDIEDIFVVPANSNYYGLDLNNNVLLGDARRILPA